MESRLSIFLVRGGLNLDLILCHNLLHDFAERRGLPIPRSGGEVDGREGKAVRDDVLLLSSGLDARTCVISP